MMHTGDQIIINESKPKTIFKIGDLNVYIDKKFNWFQRKMIRFFFGIEVINNEVE